MAITFITINPDGTSVFTGLSSDTPTAADTPITADVLRPGSIIYDSDTGGIRKYNGSVWQQDSTGGAAHVTDGLFDKPINDAGTYVYLGQAVPGSLGSAAVWSVKRITAATGTLMVATAPGTTSTQIWDNRASLTYSAV